jgi:hypothetical protein
MAGPELVGIKMPDDLGSFPLPEEVHQRLGVQ